MKEIYNYVQLTDRVGTSGQPTAEQFQLIADAGYRTVINLAMADSDNAVANEGSLVAGAGMRYVHLPVPFDNPTAQDLKTFLGVMRAVKDEPVWVHCAMNLRVSAFMYHYLRAEEGADGASARSPVLEKWEPRMDDVWKGFLALPPESYTE